MSIDESMYSLLAAFGTTSPDVAPDNTAPPYIIYSRTVTTPGNYVDNSEPKEQIIYTIDVHHSTKKDARTLAESIKAALRVASFGGYVVADRDIYESEVKLYRIGIDFEVFA
jgi:hypothetical protein